jgi:mevalonate kinase
MYPAKILLFGEYSLMHGSNALAVPFRNYYGKWSFSQYCAEYTHLLFKFSDYLEDTQNKFPFAIDVQKFRKDLALGLYFESSIPISYGIGSSGALCAAFYGNYVKDPISVQCNDQELVELKRHLSLLEGYFHKTSSGIDPLVSYTNAAILHKADGSIQRLTSVDAKFDRVSLFLIDTKIYGTTSYNITLFNDLLKEEYYLNEFRGSYKVLVNKCISMYLESEHRDFISTVGKLSSQQQSFFEPMIPSGFLKYFQIAEDTAKFSLKLCGSGGGGFLLGFTSDIEYVNKLFQADSVKLINVELSS